MAACDPVVFEDVSPEKWACLQAKIAAEGYAVTGDAGEATASGVTLTWAYDSAAQTLTIQCTKHPFVLPCALVNAKIKSLYDNSGC
ncbi:MAG TPA: hypothetical protein VF595_14355 [Tepidisphaeraceae bacterium]|jgi:hypothetical protein